jgi:hypothetical protein
MNMYKKAAVVYRVLDRVCVAGRRPSLKDKKNKDKDDWRVCDKQFVKTMVKVVNQRTKDDLRIQEPSAWRKRHKVR